MKQKDNLWWFESHQEIRDYLSQGLNRMQHFIYLTTRQRAWIGDYGKVVADCDEEGRPYVIKDGEADDKPLGFTYSRDHSIRGGIGDIGDYPAEDYAVRTPWQVVELEAPTAVEGFYKAGEHLAARVCTVGEQRTAFTTKELTAVKDAVELDYSPDVVYLYRIRTATGLYQCHQDSLWAMMLAMEKAEGVSPAKRRVFTIRQKEDAMRNVILRLQFTVDKEVQRLKGCLEDGKLRPAMCHPAVETASGVIVGTNGHILTVHRLKDYRQDEDSALPVWAKGMLSVPREVCQMKGTVTVSAAEGKWEESYTKHDGSTELTEVSGIIVTATDQGGRQAVLKVSQYFVFPNWRSVIPRRVGPAIGFDAKVLADSTRLLMPQLNGSSEMMRVAASSGDGALKLSGEDYDFSKEGSVSVAVAGKVPCDVYVGLKAPTVLLTTGFAVSAMHFTAADRAVLFVGGDTFALMMPMLVDGYKDAPHPTDRQLKRFDLDGWIDGKTPKASGKPKAGKFEKAVDKAVACEEKWEDRIRHYVAENYPTQAVVSAATDSPRGEEGA